MTDAPFEPHEDVNEAAEADWKDETTAFERVRAVAKRTYEPQSADEIASRALTTPATARKHLEVLLENGFVTTISDPDRSATLYRRSSESLVLERVRDILRELGTEELADQIIDLQAEIQEYREVTGADSPRRMRPSRTSRSTGRRSGLGRRLGGTSTSPRRFWRSGRRKTPSSRRR